MTDSHAPVPVTHNARASRFEVSLEGQLAVAEYRRRGDVVHFTHTEVPDVMEGQGVGSTLARTALDHARAEGLRVVPQCPFIAAYIREHREYEELVKG